MDLINNIVNFCDIRQKEETENQLMNTSKRLRPLFIILCGISFSPYSHCHRFL